MVATCAFCGKTFTPHKKGNIYCSRGCYSKARWNKRKSLHDLGFDDRKITALLITIAVMKQYVKRKRKGRVEINMEAVRNLYWLVIDDLERRGM